MRLSFNRVTEHCRRPKQSAWERHAEPQQRVPPSGLLVLLDAAPAGHSPHARSLDMRTLGGTRPLAGWPSWTSAQPCHSPRASRRLMRRSTPGLAGGAAGAKPARCAGLRSCRLVSRFALDRAGRTTAKTGGRAPAFADVDARADTAHVAWARPALRIVLGRCVPLRCDATVLGHRCASHPKTPLHAAF